MVSLPKVLLHEHLDGVCGRKASQIWPGCQIHGPAHNDPDALFSMFFRGANQGSLAKYLEGLPIRFAVMPNEEALTAGCYEQAEI